MININNKIKTQKSTYTTIKYLNTYPQKKQQEKLYMKTSRGNIFPHFVIIK